MNQEYNRGYKDGVKDGKIKAYFNIKRILRKYSEDNCINIIEEYVDEIIGGE